MKAIRILAFVLLFSTVARAASVSNDTLSYGKFGKLHLYKTSPFPTSIVIFVSGDGGWNLGVVDMAKELAQLDALVIGIDITHYLKALQEGTDKCCYPAGDFEALSQYVQTKLNYPSYEIPILVGYSSGATLVYAILVQAPPNTFKGAISLGFCPDLDVSKPFCKGRGIEFEPGPKGKGVNFLPAKNLLMPWIALQGTIDQVCDDKATVAFVKQVPKGEIIVLPKVGHGFSVPRNWMPQFKDAFTRMQHASQIDRVPTEEQLKDLPLVEVLPSGNEADYLAVIVSGDGGWASIDREIGQYLAGKGIPVIGLNALKYFWKRRTPDEASGDLNRIVRCYLGKWKKTGVILVGYSRGADVLPFMTNRLPADLLQQVKLVALLGPEKSVDFQFHLTDWLGSGQHNTDLPTLPEVQKLKGLNVLCVGGAEEKESLCGDIDSTLAKVVILKGGHHLGGNYDSLGQIILSNMP